MSDQTRNEITRRRVFAAAGTAGALAAVATVLPRGGEAVVAEALPKPPVPEHGGGYQDTAHVRQYYRTARV